MKQVPLIKLFDDTLSEIAELRLKKDGRNYYQMTYRYGLGEKPRYLSTIMFVNSMIKSINGEVKILDVGCDVGLMAIIFQKMGLQVSTIDKVDPPSESKNYGVLLKEILQSKDIVFKKCDLLIDDVPFPDETFDIVDMSGVFEHFPHSHKKVMKELNRVTKRGGYLILNTPNIATGFNRLMFLLGKPILPSIDWFYNSDDYEGHFREFTLAEMRSVFSYAGFEIVKEKMLDFSPYRSVKYEESSWKVKSQSIIVNSVLYIASILLPRLRPCIWIVGRKL